MALVKGKKHTVFHYLIVFLFSLMKSLVGSLIWCLILIVGIILFLKFKTPFNLILGGPLVLVSGGMIINSIATAFFALVSPKYNKAICFICSSN
ncbi:hypothetical protein HY025_03025 [Candidatus Daviesbacteria bacterium]|nr:hypothetical protein [Candidatus Daviesbacteria bacterium]